MKTLLLVSLLPVWIMMEVTAEVTVTEQGDGIKLTCPNGYNFTEKQNTYKEIDLRYKDEKSGEYTCKSNGEDTVHKIYVKFRTCDNCIELDVTAAAGMVIGNVVATVMIGVAVYHIASQSSGSQSSVKKASDRRVLLHNESHQNTSSQYQELNPRTRKHDIYSGLHENN